MSWLRLKTWTLFCITLIVISLQICLAGYYADNGMDQTIIYRTLPKSEKREMQQEILNLLGFNQRPKPKLHERKYSAPRYLLDLYNSFKDEDDGEIKLDASKAHNEFLTNNQSLRVINDSDVIMSFLNHAHHHSPHLRHDNERRFWFDVSEVSPQERIIKAELNLYRDAQAGSSSVGHSCNLQINVLRHGSKIEDIILEPVDNLTIDDKSHGWLTFNVTEPLITWIAFPRENMGLLLQIHCDKTGHEVHPHDLGLVSAGGRSDQQPFMVAFLKSSGQAHSRVPRATRKRHSADVSYSDLDERPYFDTRPSGRRNSCQKRNLFVSFRDLGWQDWIIAPDGYAAFYCHGECSFPLNRNATNHAIVQTLVHLVDPTQAPKPCCAPTRLSAIMVLYFDDNSNVILKRYKNMVVKACGCH
ncbi:bone morphogenetic protein 7 [Ixodes scapularis]|nr:bone morphogenetic protein 7 [Ixodes scapularis]